MPHLCENSDLGDNSKRADQPTTDLISADVPKGFHRQNENHLEGIAHPLFKIPAIPRRPRMQAHQENDRMDATLKEAPSIQRSNAKSQIKLTKREKRQQELVDQITAFQPAKSLLIRETPSNGPRHEFMLPKEALHIAIDHLVRSFEPDGIRGVGLVVADLVSISASCKRHFLIGRYGFQSLARTLNRFFPTINDLEDVVAQRPLDRQTLVTDPMSMPVKPLMNFLKVLKVTPQGHKEGIPCCSLLPLNC